MGARELYESKKMTPEQFAATVEPGDRIFCMGQPDALFGAVYTRYRELENVLMFWSLSHAENPLLGNECNGHIDILSWFYGKSERDGVKNGRNIRYMPGHLSQFGRVIKERVKPTKVYVHASAMNEDGYIALGNVSYGVWEAIEGGAELYLQINGNMPFILGECNIVHISQVAGFIEHTVEIPYVPDIPITPEDEKIAGYILERIRDGSTLQLGWGAVPNSVGHGLGQLKDLGIFSEMFADCMKDLMDCGAVNNSRKSLTPGISDFCFVHEKERLFRFADRNPGLAMRRITWLNNPAVIAQQHDFVSINSCLAVDLTGQVYSEALGTQQYSGIGGQADFVRGARLGGGQSFLAMHSVTKDHTSKIALSFLPCSPVSVPRSDVHMIVTEHGVADLMWKSDTERAEALIAVAHPDFRDELTFRARKSGLLY